MAVRWSATGQHYTRSLSLGAGSYTITCWFKLSVNRATFSTMWTLDNGSGSGDLLGAQANGTTFYFYGDGTATPTLFTATVDTWYFVGVSRSGTGGTAYHRAVTASSLSAVSLAGSGTSAVDNASGLTVGETVGSTTEWPNGCMAGFKLWHGVALSQAEIEAEADQYQPSRTANLAVYHPFVRAETVDYSGNARTLSGGSGATTEAGPPIRWGRTVPIIVRTLSGGGSPVTVNDRPGSLIAAAPAQALVVGRTVLDRPGPTQLAGPGQALAVDRSAPDRAGHLTASNPATTATVGVTRADTAAALLAAGRAETVLVGRSLAVTPGALSAAGTTPTLAVGVTIGDRAGAALAGQPPAEQVSQANPVNVADRAGQVLAGRPPTEQVSAIAPVSVADRPVAVAAAGPGQAVVVDRILADRPAATRAGAPSTIAAVDRSAADRSGSATATNLGQAVAVGRTVNDRPGAVVAGGSGQVVVVEVIHRDRPGLVSAANPATILAEDVTVADRPWAALAAIIGQSVRLGDVLVGWPPIVTGPHLAPLITVTGPHAAPLLAATGPHTAPLLAVTGPSKES